jgi:hypothetical protein
MRLFIDLDGVLADFDTGYEQCFGTRPSITTDSVDWRLVRDRPHFYRDLPPMPDFQELWEGVQHLRPTILTGVPHSIAEAKANKREWVDLHLGTHVPMIGCRSVDKSLHMKAPGDVLIDDWTKYRHLWIERGGHWITHTSADESLRLLQEYLS